MMRSRRSLWCVCLPALLLAGCRGTLGGLPTAGAPAPEGVGTKVSTRVMPFGHVGKSNTIIADMPVPRPDTQPCVVTLFHHYIFQSFSNQTFGYRPPATCPGPWAKVVFNFDVRVTKGVQYDRTGIIWVDGAAIYFGTTAEPSQTLSPHWHVERDVTDLSALFAQRSKGQVELWNCYCPPTYNGYQIGTATLQFYPPDKKYPAPRVADQVLGVPYDPPLGGVSTLPQSPMTIATALPKNIVSADLDLYLQSQDKEEQWFMCVPDDVWQASLGALGFCRNTAFREGVVSVNGQAAGLAPIYPWIYTGGMDPYLWFPIPGVQTLEFVPFRVDLTPFAGELSSGSMSTIDVSVFRSFAYFSGAGDLLLFLDQKKSKVTGKLTQDTLTAKPELDVINGITYGSGAGLFGGAPAQGSVRTRSRSDYTIAGYVDGSAGRVTTTVTAGGLFENTASFDYTAHRYVQLVNQNTHFESTSTTQTRAHESAGSSSYDFPLSVSYPILTTRSGYKLPIKVYQGYRAQSTNAGGATTEISNTVKSNDTMIFSPGFSWIGVKNGASIQLYTYTSKHPAICYGKRIESKNNVVTAIGNPGCSAQPPPRRRPRP